MFDTPLEKVQIANSSGAIILFPSTKRHACARAGEAGNGTQQDLGVLAMLAE